MLRFTSWRSCLTLTFQESFNSIYSFEVFSIKLSQFRLWLLIFPFMYMIFFFTWMCWYVSKTVKKTCFKRNTFITVQYLMIADKYIIAADKHLKLNLQQKLIFCVPLILVFVCFCTKTKHEFQWQPDVDFDLKLFQRIKIKLKLIPTFKEIWSVLPFASRKPNLELSSVTSRQMYFQF